ncbi:hypothetical protein, partial [Methanosarcina mazei]|uniref:hypothetical protein n=1 Tax=Methanosarcina mazei TaxID=2209 RepID=UPI00064E23DE
FFDENFKDKYVTWSGTVSTVTESSGSYAVQVVHKSSTLISDVRVEFRADQKDKLIQLKEGDPITYTAKMTKVKNGVSLKFYLTLFLFFSCLILFFMFSHIRDMLLSGSFSAGRSH